MADIFDELDEQPKKRTTFITVLCILTFIGSGLILLKDCYNYVEAKSGALKMQQARKAVAQDSAKNKESAEFSKKIFEPMAAVLTEANIKKSSLAGILSAILCLGGAFFMWQINKKGFFLYLAGTLVSIVAPFVIFGNNFLAIGTSVFWGFFGLVFCILYAVNLKDMK
jgi:predicted cobalt transporter CbtA